MATRPTDSTLFATDATYTLDGDTWSGDPTKVDPGATRRAEGYEPDTVPAEWLNWQIGLLGQATDWSTALLTADEEHTYQTPKSRRIPISLDSNHNFPTTAWSRSTSLTSYYWAPTAISDVILFPIDPYIRHGQTIDAVRMLVTPDSAGPTTGMAIGLWVASPRFETGALLAAVPSIVGGYGYSSGTALQVVSAALGGSHTVKRLSTDVSNVGGAYFIAVFSSDTVVGGDEKLQGLEITISDNGPRNA